MGLHPCCFTEAPGRFTQTEAQLQRMQDGAWVSYFLSALKGFSCPARIENLLGFVSSAVSSELRSHSMGWGKLIVCPSWVRRDRSYVISFLVSGWAAELTMRKSEPWSRAQDRDSKRRDAARHGGLHL